MATVFWDRKGVLMVEFVQKGVTVTSHVYFETLKNCKASQNKRRGMLKSGVVFWIILTGSCLTILLTNFISLPSVPPVRQTRSGWDDSGSTLMRCWWKMLQCGWGHRQQVSLTQTYKNLFPDTRSASIRPVTYVENYLKYVRVFVYNFFLIECFVKVFHLFDSAKRLDRVRRPLLWSSGQSSWLKIHPVVRVRFPALTDFLRSSESGKRSTQSREYNWGATWKKK
jgi:hypothetical protein